MRLLAALFCLFMFPALAAQLTAGPMPGHVTSRSAYLWLQADGPAQVQVEYWQYYNPRERRMSLPQPLQQAADFTARIELTDLLPGTRYGYAVYLDGIRALPEAGFKLDTLPDWRWRRAPADFTVYLGSCAYVNDPPWDRPGTPYGGDYGIFSTLAKAMMANAQPHFMLWLGDNIYFRETDLESPWAMNARYRQQRSLPELQPLLQATAHYALWDDHDYGSNDANRSFVFKDASIELFQRYWANPGYGLKALPGIFTQFSLLDADFFLLDDRFYRTADKTLEENKETNWLQELKDLALGSNQWTRLLGRRYMGGELGWLGETKAMFGAAQLDWLKQALINSTAPFKIVASGSQLLNDANTREGWQNFRNEREPFLEWLTQQKIAGVIFLSGDRHHTELIKRKRKDGYPLHELTCSPLTAGAGSDDAEMDNAQRVAGTLVAQRNYCSLEFTGQGDNRRVLLRAFDVQGKPLWERSIGVVELRAPPAD